MNASKMYESLYLTSTRPLINFSVMLELQGLRKQVDLHIEKAKKSGTLLLQVHSTTTRLLEP